MSVPTESELLFEQLCGETGIRFTRITPASEAGHRTPDYELHLQVPPILVEVKQIDPNKKDKDLLRQLQKTGMYKLEGKERVRPGERVRRKISEASSQLKAQVRTGQPALLIIYNNVHVLRGFTDPVQMMAAMYGRYEAVLTGRHGPAAWVLSVALRLGGSRGLTPEHNTTLSAVAVLFEGPEGPYLVVYHNRFASNPILPEVLRHPRILQRSIGEGGPEECPEWVEV